MRYLNVLCGASLSLAMISLAACDQIDPGSEVVEYTGIDLSSQVPLEQACRLDLEGLSQAAIFAGGGYQGKELGYTIDDSRNSAGQFEVLVNSPDRPALVMLGAYRPTIWNIAWTENTQIAGVVLSGYHRQVVAGLPENTPLTISTRENEGRCGYFYISRDSETDINAFSQLLLGKLPDAVFKPDGNVIIMGEPISESEKLLTSTDTPPTSFIDTTSLRTGKAGLDQLMAAGKLRKATVGDLRRWDALASKLPNNPYEPMSIGAITSTRPDNHEVGNVYVILEKIEIPADLYGGNSVEFFLWDGVEYPDGDPGHSMIHNFNDMSCKTQICRYMSNHL